PQPYTVLAPPTRHRRHERYAEHLVRHLSAERLEQLQLFRRRQPGRHHVRILERRNRARIGAVHHGLVGPFEIERIDDRFAYPGILELVATGVEEPALSARRQFIRQSLALDATILDRRKVVTRSPDPRGELLAVEIV